ncbi:hypothetical protein D210916BOD24_11090 [Alteromonas sp. D210916BOD_24]|uniref:hypothetical protein n=1 Tax=Alteromonas sp. D210916BOD_24 TaxID=3157618 RepID=UPI00399CC14C
MASKTQDISNCVSAPFDEVDSTSPGKWSLCYNGAQNLLSLSVSLSPPAGLIESSTPLSSTINSEGLTSMINYLYQVKNQMQKSKQAGNSGN